MRMSRETGRDISAQFNFENKKLFISHILKMLIRLVVSQYMKETVSCQHFVNKDVMKHNSLQVY